MISFKELVEAGVHFGHHTSRWHPKMRPYLWGQRNKVHLINVAKTAFLLDRAEKFLTDAAATGRPVLWVGTKRPAQQPILAAGTALSMPYVTHRWIGGTLSNFEQVRKAVTRLMHLRDVKDKTMERYSKKEQSMFMKELDRLEKSFGGLTELTELPAALVVVDAKREHAAIKEALVMNIPIISVVDTNTNPTGITYIIPSNDDSPKAITLLVSRLQAAAAVGTAQVAEKVREAANKKAAAATAAKALSIGGNADIIIEEDGEDEDGAKRSKKSPLRQAAPDVAIKPLRKPAMRRPAGGANKGGRGGSK